MKRFKVVFSYDGSNFNGFQRQRDDNQRSVQQEMEQALEKIHHQKVVIASSGRTDRGVHAISQVCHFDSELKMNGGQFKKALNSLLPKDIYVKEVFEVDVSFHARFSCVEKEYHYFLNMGEYNPLLRNYIYQYGKKLNYEKMLEAANLFIGEHDFRNFCTNQEDEKVSFVRHIKKIEIIKDNDQIKFIFIGDGFLRYMVRMIVAIIIEVGLGKKQLTYIKERLDSNEMKRSSYNVGGEGLYLFAVRY